MCWQEELLISCQDPATAGPVVLLNACHQSLHSKVFYRLPCKASVMDAQWKALYILRLKI